MASAFNIELAMSESPAEAQARAADAFTEPARPSDFAHRTWRR